MDNLQSSTSKVASATPVIEVIGAHVTKEWLADRQIVVFKITAAARDDVDTWIDTVKATMNAWPNDYPYLAIHDMTSDKVSLTPYARARAEELLPLGAKTPGYAAIVLARSFVSQVIRLFMRTQKQQGVHNEIFFSVTDAINWLTPKMGKVKAEADIRVSER